MLSEWQGWLFLIEFLKWYFSKYWQVQTRRVFAQTVTYTSKITFVVWIYCGSGKLNKCERACKNRPCERKKIADF